MSVSQIRQAFVTTRKETDTGHVIHVWYVNPETRELTGAGIVWFNMFNDTIEYSPVTDHSTHMFKGLPENDVAFRENVAIERVCEYFIKHFVTQSLES